MPRKAELRDRFKSIPIQVSRTVPIFGSEGEQRFGTGLRSPLTLSIAGGSSALPGEL